jgi:hypothetical protein
MNGGAMVPRSKLASEREREATGAESPSENASAGNAGDDALAGATVFAGKNRGPLSTGGQVEGAAAARAVTKNFNHSTG